MNRRYPPEMEGYVRELTAQRKTCAEIARLCEERFGLGPISVTAMRSYRFDRGIALAPKYTPQLLEDLRELVKTHSLAEAAEILSASYNLNLNRAMVKGLMARFHILTGRDGRFEKGHANINKGKPVSPETLKRISATWFTKGHKPHNLQSVGSEVITEDGYVKVKVRDEGTRWQRWMFKHRVVWEQAHGPLKEGQLIEFLDGNRQNCELSNLVLLDRTEHAVMNTRKLRFDDPELTRTGVAITRLEIAAKRKQK